ncbi:MAG: hypothetical protein BMS9Abin05_0162 [Rhodothermia bacterium]|nr:MAG: hypothetical protein BMS9Abin05_0162 [Rhodothermia bacterium]
MTRRAAHTYSSARRVVVLLFVSVSVMMTVGSSVSDRGTAQIDRISFSPTGESEYHLRLHSDDEIPWFSTTDLEEMEGLRLTLLNTRLAPDPVLETAEGPVQGYTVREENGKVLLDVVFTVPGLNTAVHQDPDSFDMILVITGDFNLPSVKSLSLAELLSSSQSDSIDTVSLMPGTPEDLIDSSTLSRESRPSTPIPNRISVAGPAALPRRADIANIEKSSKGKSNGIAGSTPETVVSDMDRLFASALSKNAPSKQEKSSVDNRQSNTPGSQWKLDTIVIDAGHGGWDEGAFGPGGTLEKDLALDLAMELGQLLSKKLGVNVVYTRTDDRFISLAERGRIANQAGGKLFLSIHANSSKYRSARGTETFFLGIHRSDSAQVVMERENEVIKLESDSDQYRKYTQASLARQALAQSSFMRHSERLAEVVQKHFRDGAIRRDRGVKQAGFYVLFGASMPAVLIELGFLTNPYEERFLASADGQTSMANAIFRAVETFKLEYEKSLQIASQ